MAGLASKLIKIYGDTDRRPVIKGDVVITNIRKIVLIDCAVSENNSKFISLYELKNYFVGNDDNVISIIGKSIYLTKANSVSNVVGGDEYCVGFGTRYTAVVRVVE